MRTIWKVFFAACGVAIIGVIALVVAAQRYHRSGPPAQERQARETAIRPLVQRHATREEIFQALGLQVVDYSRDSTNRWVIEQRVSEAKVRQLADRHPGVLFHTTMHWKTWLFFDAEGKLQDYLLSAQ